MEYPLSNAAMDALQKFQARLNSEPKPESLQPTPDGKARTVTISHVEMTLDELIFGQWCCTNFTWSNIANEVQGAIELIVTHPVTGERITRIGAGSVVITVDKVPDEIKNNPQEKNSWALNPANKKSNALDLAFPKLKAECLKNAAQSLGKIFGRDINRKVVDMYKPFKLTADTTGLKELPPSTMTLILEAIKLGQDEYQIREGLDAVKHLMTEQQLNEVEELLNARA